MALLALLLNGTNGVHLTSLWSRISGPPLDVTIFNFLSTDRLHFSRASNGTTHPLGLVCRLLLSGVDVPPPTQTLRAEPLIKFVEQGPDGASMIYGVPRP